jgi:hypothetical protein
VTKYVKQKTLEHFYGRISHILLKAGRKAGRKAATPPGGKSREDQRTGKIVSPVIFDLRYSVFGT